MRTALTLCTGNICRSPMAAALLARAVPRLQVQSAGIAALVGSPADPMAIAIASANGIDLSGHRAMQVDGAQCGRADLILAMETAQLAELERRFPFIRGKAFRMCTEHDIADPHGRPRQAFEIAWHAVAAAVDDWADRIRRFD
jgi:protein-tyrosine phosphatase